ncbi:tetratricopeptide repeat protein [Paludibaculum fermentans]|uniref:Tetratricopeptide repeat protein n=1 Tax=Paludibaculum fermentans TaxID=1473598 RepID=A0A7S7NTB7_PALFE|nr:tetratricopeptide repeat protein [Paludibaculum fermentans]QOY89447.1 tetratricopeptide repeat protein [Paludibaculum fermentans]
MIQAAPILLFLLAGAPADCWRAKKLGHAQEAGQCFTALRNSNNPALRAEGQWGMGDFNGANETFRSAVKSDEKNAALRVRWGRLLMERFNPGDAAGLFGEALGLDKDNADALLGMAMLAEENFDQKAIGLAQQALEKNPKLIEARELRAAVLLEDGNYDAAAAEALNTVQDAPQAIDAMSVLATIDLLKDKGTSPWTGRMLAVNPHYGEGFARIARQFVLNRRYEEAIGFYRKSLELDPSFLPAKSELGINLMRIGEDVEARRLLGEVFEAGYRNAATANSLTLLDSYKNFIVYKQPRYILRLHKSEAELLRPYVEREITRALDSYDRKYNFKLPGPVLVEMYPDHQDFAVRTMGMPGLGALGVTFGLSVAMDSPSGRKPGDFHWASTLWHELSHVYLLTVTKHHVPRWFTEGVSVHEETAVSPEWGDRLTPEILGAMKKKTLLPISTLDRGYMRPSYPAQVIVSYFQGGRTIDYITEKYGWPKVMTMLGEFSQVTTTAAVIEKVLGVKPEQFDKDFLAWLENEHKVPLAKFEDWTKQMKPLHSAVKGKQWDEVFKIGNAIRDEYPDYVEAGSVYEALAEAYQAQDKKPQAIAELERYAKQGGRDPETLKKLARLQEEAGNPRAAEAALNRLLYIYPVKDEELHRKLGGLRATLGKWDGAAEEWRAVLAMKTVDPASANYELARAYQGMKRVDDAKDAVLAALEAAPGYRPAQKLLLELNRKE